MAAHFSLMIRRMGWEGKGVIGLRPERDSSVMLPLAGVSGDTGRPYLKVESTCSAGPQPTIMPGDGGGGGGGVAVGAKRGGEIKDFIGSILEQ